MRDVADLLVPSDDATIPLEQHLRFLDHLATFHASCWGWKDTVGLLPLTNRYCWFSPTALACERALGSPNEVPVIAEQGWARLPEVAPRFAAARAARRRAVATRRCAGARDRRPSSPATGRSRTSGAIPMGARSSSTGLCRGWATDDRARPLPRAELGPISPPRPRRPTRSPRTAVRWNATASTPSRGSIASSTSPCSA